jgi:hypothetical protein
VNTDGLLSRDWAKSGRFTRIVHAKYEAIPTVYDLPLTPCGVEGRTVQPGKKGQRVEALCRMTHT